MERLGTVGWGILWARLALVVVAMLMTGCTDNPKDDDELLVFAAVSMMNALEEIIDIYEQEAKTEVIVSYAGSQVLAQQIASGAKADIFVSAGDGPMEFLRERSLIDDEAALLRNKLVVVTKPQHEDNDIREFDDLTKFRRIAIADPDLAPAGHYAREALQSTNLWESLMPRLILGSDVRTTLGYVETGNVDVALVYATDAAVASTLIALDVVPVDSYSDIIYPAATLRRSTPSVVADDFLVFLKSNRAQRVFDRFGFGLLP